MEAKTETKIALSILAVGVAGTIYTISQKKNTLILDKDKQNDAIKVISFFILGAGSALAFSNSGEIAKLIFNKG